MSLNQILPFISTAVILIFVIKVLQRYFATRKLHFLFWGAGLAMFGVGSYAEAHLSLFWNPWVFFGWYLFGAALNAAWIGHGTLNLLVRKNWVHVVTGVLVIGSLAATALMLQVMPKLDEDIFTTDQPISEQYGTKRLEEGETAPAGKETAVIDYRGEQVTVVRGLLPLGSTVRLTTPFFNIYGLITLVGGAIWSAYLFWRKEVLLNRVWANVLIAAGALLIGFASTLTRLGYGQYLYIGELLAAILMFAGFELASNPERKNPTGKNGPGSKNKASKIDRGTWGTALIILGVSVWLPYFYLLGLGREPSIFPFLAAHLAGVLSGGWLRSGLQHGSKPSQQVLRWVSRILIYLGVLAWAPYFYLTRVIGVEAVITPFLAAHLTGVLSGLGLRLYLQFR